MLQTVSSALNPFAWDYIHLDGTFSEVYEDELYYLSNVIWYTKFVIIFIGDLHIFSYFTWYSFILQGR